MKYRVQSISLFFLITTFLFSISLTKNYAQTEINTSESYKTYSIASSELNEERVFSIFLPASYETTSKPYPLLIILDGEDFFYPFAGTVDYFSKIGKCPELIVAGINSKDRWHDYTPTKAGIPGGPQLPSSGGADSFLKFINNELIPLIESKYRLTSFRVLFGHSIAGLFSVYNVFKNQSTFSGFIATSPSLWWDNEFITKICSDSLAKQKDRPGHLFFTMGNEGTTMLQPALNFQAALNKLSSEDIKWKFQQFENFDHQTMPVKAFTFGMENIFSDWPIPQQICDSGIEKVLEYYKNLSSRYLQILLPPENLLNRLGYIELNKGKEAEAIKIFRINSENYPYSANVFDSLGEAYLKSGDTVNAIINYKKSLALNPENKNAKEVLQIEMR